MNFARLWRCVAIGWLCLGVAGCSPVAEDAEPAGPAPRAVEGPRPNVLLYVIDTLRADHLGTYGHPAPVSPHIDALAAEGLLFERAFAQSSWTRPATASMLSGLLPRVHGANDVDEALSGDILTLAEALGAAGYHTAGFVTNGNVGPELNFDQGYDDFFFYPERHDTPEVHTLSNRVNEDVFAWLEGRPDPSVPFFLYVHTVDPHDPHTPPEPWRTRFAPNVSPDIATVEWMDALREGRLDRPEDYAESMKALYDAEIAFNDHHFGRLVAELRARELYDDTIIVVTSDHGEAFFDHQWRGHGLSLHWEELQIPFIVKPNVGAGLSPRRDSRVAQQIDLFPTLLDLVGIRPPEPLPGVSLLRDDIDPERPAFAYLRRREFHADALRSGSWAILRDFRKAGTFGTRLYQLARDPRETHNLRESRPDQVATFAAALERHRLAAEGFEAPVELSPETEESLRLLGYLQ